MSKYAIFDKSTGKPADNLRFDSKEEAINTSSLQVATILILKFPL